MRRGRVHLSYRPTHLRVDTRVDEPSFEIVPEDGGDPIELPVRRAALSFAAGGIAELLLRTYIGAVDLSDLEGRRVQAAGHEGLPAIYPQARVFAASGERYDIARIGWAFDVNGRIPQLRLLTRDGRRL